MNESEIEKRLQLTKKLHEDMRRQREKEQEEEWIRNQRTGGGAET